ncbi:alpha/beta hydrolase [Nannocystis pusilla]|uniref:alpha/beta hydrolase n=1 Tax=Nannocystis pusilla TaxID=889268 RepID=UPI003B77A6B2
MVALGSHGRRRLRRWWIGALVLLVLGLGFLRLGPATFPSLDAPTSGAIALQVGWLWSGLSLTRYEIGTLYVPENRNAADSRLIGVGFLRIRGTRGGDVPVFLLPGGPGDSYLDAFTDRGLDWWRHWGRRDDVLRFREAGDVVVIDQRAYSRAGDVLRYASNPFGQPLDAPASAQADAAAAVAVAERALQAYADKDLAGYTVVDCADDVNALRQALGYERISLFGLSFGSQWSFALMRKYPHSIARAVLAGVEPLDHGYDMPSDVLAALERIAAEADRDPALAPWLPPGGLMQAVTELLQRLSERPLRVTIQAGGSRTVLLGPGDFQLSLLRRPRDWPARVLSIYHGDYDDWAREVFQQRQASEVADTALIAPLIDTSLGITPERRLRLLDDPARSILGEWNFLAGLTTAEVWPTADVGDEFRRPVRNATPVVFVHGDWDTSTPIENTLQLRPFFPNSRAVIVRRGGHGAIYQLAREQPRVLSALMDFLRTGAWEGLPAEVNVAAPEFARPDGPPRAATAVD